jgi:hypothetical protein
MKNQYNNQRSNTNSNRNNGGNNGRSGYGNGQGRGNQQQQDTTFFNLHTIAMGYINRVEMVQGNNGDFLVVNFGALEGPSNNTETKYINLTVPAKAVEAIIKVFASIRIAGLSASPFEFGPQSKTPGKLGVNYTGKLINMMSLKVGHDVIDLEGGDSSHENQNYDQGHDAGYVPPQAPRNQQQAPQYQQQAPRQQGPAPKNNGYAPKQQYGSHRG